MKFYVFAILLTILGLSLTADIHHDGEPGCKEPIEFEIVYFRNNWDATRYWACLQRGEPAESILCPIGHGWLDSVKKCVEWHDWKWEEPTHPPSRP